MSYPYKYQPKGVPAPFLSVKVQNPLDDSKKLMCEALLDTGSDISYFPVWLLNAKLDIMPSGGPEEVEGIGGVTTYYVYLASITINSEKLNKKVLGWEKEFALIGRDILNLLCVEFDGPHEEFRFATPAIENPTFENPFKGLSRFLR